MLHAAHPFDAVLEHLWGDPAQQTLAAGPTMSLAAGVLRGSGIVMTGVGLGSVPPEVLARVRAEALPRLFEMVASGTLQLRTLARPLAEVADAWAAQEPSGTRVVLVP
jgi:hypothetical protein